MEMIQVTLSEWWTLHAMMSPWLLLGLVVAGSLGVFFTRAWLVHHLGSSGFGAILKATVLGIPLPLCSCSVIPMGIGLHRKGASRAASLSFLTSTPQTGVDSIFLTAGVLGWPLVMIKVVAALLMGLVVGVLNMNGGQRESKEEVQEEKSDESKGWKGWVDDSLVELPGALAKPYLIGVTLSVILTLSLPDDSLAKWVGPGLAGMALALLVSLPTYVCATASVPLALMLLDQGMGVGGVLVFLLAGPASNGATMMVIAKTFGWPSFFKYFLTIVVFSFLAGSLLESWMPSGAVSEHLHHHEKLGLLEHLSGLVLFGLFLKPLMPKGKKLEEPTTELQLEGLTCMGCVQKVTKALGEKGIALQSIDTKSCSIPTSKKEEAKAVIQGLGFKAEGAEG
jgi:hypothetical protein